MQETQPQPFGARDPDDGDVCGWLLGGSDLIHVAHGDVDFQRVDIQQTVETPVPVSLIGQEDAPGTAGGAGVVTQGMFEILVRAKPFDVPNEIIVDTSGMEEIDSVLLASDVPLPAGVELAGNEDDRVCWIQPPRVTAEEDLVPVGEEELIEGVEGEVVEGEDGDEDAEESGETEDSGKTGSSPKEE